MQRLIIILIFSSLTGSFAVAQHSVARQWNEVLLQGIRNDFARPTVHARNLFHTSVAMYDAWAVCKADHETYFLGKTIAGFDVPFDPIEIPADVEAFQEEAISYASFRLLKHRFKNSPRGENTNQLIDELFTTLGYDSTVVSTDYSTGSAAALGNYIAIKIIEFGLQDGANEANDYDNLYYRPSNFQFLPETPGNSPFFLPNNWQPIAFETFIDQSGTPIPVDAPPFLSPEWGNVVPFAMTEADVDTFSRFGFDYKVYHNPGPPCLISNSGTDANSAEYKWGFSLVSIWASHLDPNDGVMWDISPGSIGNVQEFPTTIPGLRDFYDRLGGGDPSIGHEVNPYTGEPYEPQMVPRADYARVLAEFWADGPDSETPPGHWFTILNYVNDHEALVKQYKGEGPILDDLEWDVKAYFTLGGAMHDAAITAWSIKGWYDYVRPISAIRWMATLGQSTDSNLPSYDPQGMELEEGFIELVEEGDPLAGENNEHVGKIKLYTWRGPTYINDPETEMAGVGWILGENWWPFQRPTFITPPFAGYVSGHSTYSRAAAEVLTLFTGDEFFPGGMGTFEAKQNEFLVFEEGPSVDIELQWATYRDASDQTSLSRIWGGIHPPVDDIPGRLIGMEVGVDAFEFAEQYFNTGTTSVVGTTALANAIVELSPNPVQAGISFSLKAKQAIGDATIQLYNTDGKLIDLYRWEAAQFGDNYQIGTEGLPSGTYFIRMNYSGGNIAQKFILLD